MEASKAAEIATSPDELQDLQDDQLIHQQTEPEPEPELEDELTNDIEKDPPKQPRAKRPRTKAQQEAFKKAQEALKAKRAKSWNVIRLHETVELQRSYKDFHQQEVKLKALHQLLSEYQVDP